MATIQADLRKRLSFILHLGFTEVRHLAGIPGFERQIHDLADAMEILPRFLDAEPNDEDMEMIRFVLSNYQSRHPTAKFDYLAYLDHRDLPDRY
jgi:hypothetical protein